MISAKSIITLLFFPVFVCGCFIAGAHTGLFPDAGIERRDMAAEAVLPLSEPAAVAEIPAAAADSPVAAGPADLGDDPDQPASSSGATVTVEKNGNSVTVRAAISGADEVLVYAEGEMLPVSLYVGKAIYDGDGNWSYQFDLDDRPLPNGKYRLYAEVTAGNKVYASSAAELEIDVPVAIREEEKAAIGKTVRENQAAIAENEKAIGEAVRSAVVSMIVLAGNNDKIRESLLSVSEMTRSIERDSRTLTEKILERQDDNEKIRRLEEDIAGLPGNTIGSVRSERLNELKNVRVLVKQLDQAVSDLQSKIEKTKKDRQTLAGEFAGLAPSAAASDAAKIVNKLEEAVSKQESNTIAKQVALEKDSDGDGLSDEKEIAAGTDPDNPDSDGDGALDGDEVANGYDPLKSGGFKKPDYRDPRTVTPKLADIYKVGQITSFKLPDGGNGVRLEGSALPGAYVRIFIYSVPIIAAVKADGQGHWTYQLDKQLPDGRHSAYVAQIDSQGEVAARSEAAIFELNGDSVFRTVTDEKSPAPASVDDLKNNFSLYAGFAVFLALVIALLVIGFTVNRAGKKKAAEK